MKKNKGITLVALVITIILLLILVGITLSLTMGEHGIIKKAMDSNQTYKIAETLDKLELQKANLVMKKSEKNEGIPSIEEYVTHLIEEQILIMENVKPVDKNIKYIIVDGYMFLVEKELDGNIKIEIASKSKIVLDKVSIELIRGKKENLNVTIFPEEITNKTIIWESSDESIATVDTTGEITAVKEGTAIIMAKVSDDSLIKAICIVNVKEPIILELMSFMRQEGLTWNYFGLTRTAMSTSDWNVFNTTSCGIGCYKNHKNFNVTFSMPSKTIKDIMKSNYNTDICFTFQLGADSPAWIYGWAEVLYENGKSYRVNSTKHNTGENWKDWKNYDVILKDIDVEHLSSISFGIIGYEYERSKCRATNRYKIAIVNWFFAKIA